MVCTCRMGIRVPYNVYKEEIRGTRPGISLFLDVISESEGTGNTRVGGAKGNRGLLLV